MKGEKQGKATRNRFEAREWEQMESMRRRNTRKRLILPQGAAKVKHPSQERDGKGISHHRTGQEDHPQIGGEGDVCSSLNELLEGGEKSFPGGI